MPAYAIGDLQGCLDPLKRLLDRIHFDPSRDRLWFTGDLVNRGPASLETLRFVRSLGERAVTVLGNHDLHLLSIAWTDDRSPRKRDTLDDILEAPDCQELLEWLRRRPLLHHDAELGFTMVHAGVPPQWDLAEARAAAAELESVLQGNHFVKFLHQMYGDKPERWDPKLKGMDRLRFIVNAFTRMRYLRQDGSLELKNKGSLNRAGKELIPWFAFPGRRSASERIVFGHWSTLGDLEQENAYGIDTGCVWGGRLTALRIEDRSRHWVECGPSLAPARSG